MHRVFIKKTTDKIRHEYRPRHYRLNVEHTDFGVCQHLHSGTAAVYSILQRIYRNYQPRTFSLRGTARSRRKHRAYLHHPDYGASCREISSYIMRRLPDGEAY